HPERYSAKDLGKKLSAALVPRSFASTLRMTRLYSDFGASAAGAGAVAAGAAPSAGAPSAATASRFFPPPFFAPPSRGTNFFLGLGNSNASPLGFCAVPPA